MAFLLVVCGVASARAEDAGEVEYARLEQGFGATIDRETVLRRLDAIAARRPESRAAPRALVWRAQLALIDGDVDGAAERFATVVHSWPQSEAAVLAWRGLGDAEYRRGRFDRAQAAYARALERAEPALRSELLQKRALVARWSFRRWVFRGALAVLAIAAALLSVGAARGRGALRVPTETIYALPIIGLLLFAAWHGDGRVQHALWTCAAGALVVITLSGLVSLRWAGRRGWGEVLGQGALVVVALLSLFYACLYGAGLLDVLRETVGGGAASVGACRPDHRALDVAFMREMPSTVEDSKDE